MATGSGDAVLVTEPGPGIRLLTLNRPRLRNAMTGEMTEAWDRALDAVAADEDVRVVVVTGEGTTFCAGADLSWFDEGSPAELTADRLRRRMLPFYRSWLRPRELPVPVLAAIDGPVLGAGVCLALACDLRYATPGASFGTSFLELGLHGGMGATWLLPEAIGIARAREMLYTGREVGAEEALSWALVNGVTANVLDDVLAIAAQIAAAGPVAVRLTKTGLEHAAGGLEAALRWESLAQPVTMTTADLREAIEARRERRPPSFGGR
ncbi:enoyl-CoA hydratase/isomerase family protein [Amycolatopsis acidiphila]|uniref:Enoyl-CoA hydratase/isomerase family protein n=1 Tax=Amycolatopsis acidiphila TaxID=715473 RepID=A0A558AFG9_9PSEU|nr:enoyl-CoA hydratase/isomerase family protein [Amycolatopsis acidiphila]TVT23004.1 enoyl-CoA hydratase/isomerase family protein [Amycolatopsis acidiphila]UIJ57172.1 enoyl-CoA hydratase/isomerase family protein [Amycolatopsis acidiphila]GHG52903.1 3-hydroxybutyryl-CoA dehydratase [Amycolatopsis acidiphila]